MLIIDPTLLSNWIWTNLFVNRPQEHLHKKYGIHESENLQILQELLILCKLTYKETH